MVRETRLSPADFIYPIFVTRTQAGPIKGMPNQFRHTIDGAVRAAQEAEEVGASGILLFGIPESKDGHWDPRPVTLGSHTGYPSSYQECWAEPGTHYRCMPLLLHLHTDTAG